MYNFIIANQILCVLVMMKLSVYIFNHFAVLWSSYLDYTRLYTRFIYIYIPHFPCVKIYLIFMYEKSSQLK